MTDPAETREAAWGKRMIEVKVRFWTDNLADGKGKIRPKHAWGAGVVRIERNDAHSIVPVNPIPFNSLLDIPAKIERLLIEQGVQIHPSTRMAKYLKRDA
jgi:hypothetical protein